MAIGDFNAILSSDDKKGSHIKGCRCQSFGDFMDKAQLHDWAFKNLLLRGTMEIFRKYLIGLIKSDHRLCHEDRIVPNRPFWFSAGWLEHHNFFDLVRDNWNFDDNMTSAFSIFTDKLKSWNKCENLIWDELESILHHKEMLWKQKSRHEWLKLGDGNTSYFHRRTIQMQNFNKITALCNEDRDWIFGPNVLKAEAANFFQKLYGENL
ncbi:uncharacterized protein LOC108451284 [Gossypium arboreum]|uniref:uncharacterized protein LOC108451284 n=1 Tax=Gossypium arboreum TaxID=29729 RepID=UPI0008194EA0|nr:uncharacterized protein LOC108451284 [Gossypium arboreum]